MAGVAAPLHAAPFEMVVTSVGPSATDGTSIVELTFLNDQSAAVRFEVPDRIAATLIVAGTPTAVSLFRDDTVARSISVAAAGFARVRYTAELPDRRGAVAVLTLAGGRGGYAFGAATPVPAIEAATAETKVLVEHVPAAAVPDSGNAFLGNFAAYEPVYAVYGPGTSTDALIQISFRYRPFAKGAGAGRHGWAGGFNFGYTQRMYWDLGAKSAPFRNIDFQPEFFYLVTDRPLAGTIAIGGQAGIRHVSNGRDGPASRSLNTVYFNPNISVPIGRWTLKLGPQAWGYIGSLSDNPDIARYRGNAGWFAQIGQDYGLRVSTTGRMDFSTGRGAIDAELSYPLNRLIHHSIDLYVFGQGFAGYGENLLDYNRRATRLRVGVGFVR
jgi:phospholipase A1